MIPWTDQEMILLLNYFKNVTSGKPCDMYISNSSEDVYKQYNEWRYITSRRDVILTTGLSHTQSKEIYFLCCQIKSHSSPDPTICLLIELLYGL